MKGKAGPNHYAEEMWLCQEQKAERIIEENLKKLGWRKSELSKRLKGDDGKIQMAQELRRNTTMSLQWIATRLGMGTGGYVYNLLLRKKKNSLV